MVCPKCNLENAGTSDLCMFCGFEFENKESLGERTDVKPKLIKHYIGVRGWLLLFVIGLVFISPLTSFQSLFSKIGLIKGFQGWTLVVFILIALLNLCQMVASIYTGIQLWRIRPNAVKLAKIFLKLNILVNLIAIILLYFLYSTYYKNLTFTEQLFGVTLQSIGYFIIWYSYLTTSKRVEATYSTLTDKIHYESDSEVSQEGEKAQVNNETTESYKGD